MAGRGERVARLGPFPLVEVGTGELSERRRVDPAAGLAEQLGYPAALARHRVRLTQQAADHPADEFRRARPIGHRLEQLDHAVRLLLRRGNHRVQQSELLGRRVAQRLDRGLDGAEARHDHGRAADAVRVRWRTDGAGVNH